jgi:hypothetical protein
MIGSPAKTTAMITIVGIMMGDRHDHHRHHQQQQ